MRQLVDKVREQSSDLWLTFIDVKKAVDSISREGLCGCVLKLLDADQKCCLIKQLHEQAKGAIVSDVGLTGLNYINRGVKLGCILASTRNV